MAVRTYPRIGQIHPHTRTRREGTGKCDNCGKPIAVGSAYAKVDIQHTYMRGDDDIATVCKPCSRLPLTPEGLAGHICDECEKKFATPQGLFDHLKSKHAPSGE